MSNSESFIKEVKSAFIDFNYSWRKLMTNIEAVPEEGENLGKSDGKSGFKGDARSRFVQEYQENGCPVQKFIRFSEERGVDKQDPDKTVGIVNWKCDEKNLINALKGRPDKSKIRRSELFEVLNYAIKKRVEILVFPELSIPFEWFPLLLEQASKHNMAIIGGLEYFIPCYLNDKGKGKSGHNSSNNRNAYNLLCGMFPIQTRYYNSSFPIVRIKNYYSPNEVEVVKGYYMDVPTTRPLYHLIHWRKCYFSLYNCFELTNISDRALFKSKVDFLTAVEFNKDTNYFSNVVESWARDLHCFILQSNPSDYGDSRIVQPTSSVTKDVLRVKGGDFPLVMVGKLKIKELREYQRMAYNLQINDKRFKPTPANYDWELTEARINNISIFDPPFCVRNDSTPEEKDKG